MNRMILRLLFICVNSDSRGPSLRRTNASNPNAEAGSIAETLRRSAVMFVCMQPIFPGKRNTSVAVGADETGTPVAVGMFVTESSVQHKIIDSGCESA